MADIYQVACPLCGTSHGLRVTDRIEGKPWIVLERENYWLKPLEFDKDKPFGVIQHAGGRGTLEVIGTFEPENDVSGSYTLIKQRLLQIVQHWVEKGWLTAEEVHQALALAVGESPAPSAPKRRSARRKPPEGS
ncbi:MAG: hypothetical protein PHU54_08475 [Candidatus Omnitrophica bacterium]|jgi:hypothetical protein|nr:hypothetical protein [Candidatus Omnitrophota bacterium]